jgi:hypothetical protein
VSLIAGNGACPGVELPNDGAGAGVPPNIGGAGVSAPNVGGGAGALLLSPVELFPKEKTGAEDDDPPNDAPAAAEPKVVAGALNLDKSPPFSGAGAGAAELLLPNEKEGAGGASEVAAAPKAGTDESELGTPSSLPRRRLLRSSLPVLGMLPSGAGGTTGVLPAEPFAAGTGACPKEKAGVSVGIGAGAGAASAAPPNEKGGFDESDEPAENEKGFDSATLLAELDNAMSPFETGRVRLEAGSVAGASLSPSFGCGVASPLTAGAPKLKVGFEVSSLFFSSRAPPNLKGSGLSPFSAGTVLLPPKENAGGFGASLGGSSFVEPKEKPIAFFESSEGAGAAPPNEKPLDADGDSAAFSVDAVGDEPPNVNPPVLPEALVDEDSPPNLKPPLLLLASAAGAGAVPNVNPDGPIPPDVVLAPPDEVAAASWPSRGTSQDGHTVYSSPFFVRQLVHFHSFF